MTVRPALYMFENLPHRSIDLSAQDNYQGENTTAQGYYWERPSEVNCVWPHKRAMTVRPAVYMFETRLSGFEVRGQALTLSGVVASWEADNV